MARRTTYRKTIFFVKEVSEMSDEFLEIVFMTRMTCHLSVKMFKSLLIMWRLPSLSELTPY